MYSIITAQSATFWNTVSFSWDNLLNSNTFGKHRPSHTAWIFKMLESNSERWHIFIVWHINICNFKSFKYTVFLTIKLSGTYQFQLFTCSEKHAETQRNFDIVTVAWTNVNNIHGVWIWGHITANINETWSVKVQMCRRSLSSNLLHVRKLF